MIVPPKKLIHILKKIELGSAVAVRLTKITGKSPVPIHPKHLINKRPWFLNYLSKNDIILDLGCHNGQNTIKAAKIVQEAVGVEIDEESLSFARFQQGLKKVKNVTFNFGNLEKKLNFKNNYFDKVLLLDVLEHLTNRDSILKEVRRILKPDGFLLLAVPNRETTWKKLQRSVKITSFSDPDHKIEFSENSIKNLLKRSKFKIVFFNYGKYDTPVKGLIDILGAIHLPAYKLITDYRAKKALENPKEAEGFEIVAQKI